MGYEEEIEKLALVIEKGWGDPTWDGKTLRPIDRQIAQAVFEAGYVSPKHYEIRELHHFEVEEENARLRNLLIMKGIVP